MYTSHKWVQPLLIGAVKSRLASLTTQSVNATGANRKQRPLLNLWLANCRALRSPHHRTCHNIWCFTIIYINGIKLNFAATEMKSQAYAPIWHNDPYLPRLQPGYDFLRAVRGFFGTQTVKNDFQLSNFVSRVRIEVFSNVNCNHNPKHIYKC